MSSTKHITRRQMIEAAAAGAAGVLAGTILQGSEQQAGRNAGASNADPKVRGPFPILSTPFTASGAVDFDVLANQARFVDWCGCPGMIWPQSGDSVDLLTTDEKLQGMGAGQGVSRCPGNTIPASPVFSELALTAEDIAEIEYRFEALQPYLKPGSPSFALRS